MDASDLFGLLGISIPLVAIIGGIGGSMFKRWMKLKEKQLDLAAKTAGEQAAQYAAKIERLEAHVAVLNRIVTDKGVALTDEIEQLRRQPLN